MKRIKSLESKVFIHYLDLPSALRMTKTMLNIDLAIAYASSLEEALASCGWLVAKNNEGSIVSLTYNSDHWRSEAEEIIRVIARYLAVGSFIVIADERHERYWRWNFNGSQFPSKKKLEKEIIDFDSKENLIYLFEKSSKTLLNQGLTLQELHDMLDKHSIDIVMDAIE